MWNNKKKTEEDPQEVEEKKVQLGDKIFGAHNNSNSTNEYK